jgi:hypothetical protein
MLRRFRDEGIALAPPPRAVVVLPGGAPTEAPADAAAGAAARADGGEPAG